jgi:hypothetical protein
MENLENKSLSPEFSIPNSTVENNLLPKVEDVPKFNGENTAPVQSGLELVTSESVGDNQQTNGETIKNPTEDPVEVLEKTLNEALKDPSEANLINLSVKITKKD